VNETPGIAAQLTASEEQSTPEQEIEKHQKTVPEQGKDDNDALLLPEGRKGFEHVPDIHQNRWRK
jgi:hypothetical protein